MALWYCIYTDHETCVCRIALTACPSSSCSVQLWLTVLLTIMHCFYTRCLHAGCMRYWCLMPITHYRFMDERTTACAQWQHQAPAFLEDFAHWFLPYDLAILGFTHCLSPLTLLPQPSHAPAVTPALASTHSLRCACWNHGGFA